MDESLLLLIVQIMISEFSRVEQFYGSSPKNIIAMYFQRIAALNGENNQFSIKRYVDESRRLFEVLDKQLASHEFIVSNEFTIADIATYPWARTYYWANVPVDGLLNFKAWFDRIDSRKATQRALEIPQPRWAFFGKGDIKSQESENLKAIETQKYIIPENIFSKGSVDYLVEKGINKYCVYI